AARLSIDPGRKRDVPYLVVRDQSRRGPAPQAMAEMDWRTSENPCTGATVLAFRPDIRASARTTCLTARRRINPRVSPDGPLGCMFISVGYIYTPQQLLELQPTKQPVPKPAVPKPRPVCRGTKCFKA